MTKIKKITMKNIIIITPFKVGSTSLSLNLKKNYGYVEIWEQNPSWKNYIDKNGIILRGHTDINYDLLNNKKFDIWFTVIRKPTEIYLSGYFQDIDNKGYKYYYGKKQTLNANTDTLLNHFMSFEWNKMHQFSFDWNFNEIYKYTGVKIYDEHFDRKKGYAIYKSKIKNIKVCVITLKDLNNKMNQIFNELEISPNDKNINVFHDNLSTNKWYKDKIFDLKKNLPKSYFNKYKKEDTKIVDHFF